MRTSDAINELVTALAAAQGEFLPIEKNRTGKVQTEKAQFSYDYADLSDVMAAVRPALSKHGLCISHDSTVHRDPVLAVSVIARLEHSSGQWKESSPLEIPCDGKMGAAQLIGSADTYGRRYTTCSILGVVAESDDDGTTASGVQSETSKRAPRPVCPQCGKSEFVFENKQAPGWFCWHNEEKKKLGCGHKWDDAAKPGYTEVSPGISAPNGSATAQAANLSADDAKFVEEASASFLECESAEAARKLWKAISDSKSPQVKTLIHPTYQRVLHSFAGSA